MWIQENSKASLFRPVFGYALALDMAPKSLNNPAYERDGMQGCWRERDQHALDMHSGIVVGLSINLSAESSQNNRDDILATL
nr:hypothetical protein [Tanacetum cinerariifolium]